MSRLYPVLRQLTAVMCTWEALGIWTRKVPTFSQLSERHRWVAPAIVGGVGIHLYIVGRNATINTKGA